MEIDVKIERIENGYIVTDIDSTGNKCFYASLEDFATCRVVENLREKCSDIKHSEAQGETYTFKLTTDL